MLHNVMYAYFMLHVCLIYVALECLMYHVYCNVCLMYIVLEFIPYNVCTFTIYV